MIQIPAHLCHVCLPSTLHLSFRCIPSASTRLEMRACGSGLGTTGATGGTGRPSPKGKRPCAAPGRFCFDLLCIFQPFRTILPFLFKLCCFHPNPRHLAWMSLLLQPMFAARSVQCALPGRCKAIPFSQVHTHRSAHFEKRNYPKPVASSCTEWISELSPRPKRYPQAVHCLKVRPRL